MPTIVVDVFEPTSADAILAKWGLTVVRQNLVPLGLADYLWMGHGGIRYTLERKQGKELVSAMGGRLDDQLRKHSQNADFVGLVIEGVITPAPNGGCIFWKESTNRKIFHQNGTSPIGYEMLMAYIWSIGQQGFPVYQFPSFESMLLGISSFVHNSMKASHSALQHHTKTKPVMFKPNPYIETLMGIGGDTRIGEKLATRIVDNVGTPYSFFNSDLQRMGPIIGDQAFIRAMKNIGRSSY